MYVFIYVLRMSPTVIALQGFKNLRCFYGLPSLFYLMLQLLKSRDKGNIIFYSLKDNKPYLSYEGQWKTNTGISRKLPNTNKLMSISLITLWMVFWIIPNYYKSNNKIIWLTGIHHYTLSTLGHKIAVIGLHFLFTNVTCKIGVGETVKILFELSDSFLWIDTLGF